MPDKIITIQGGNVLATDAPRTVRGLLLPYNEAGRTNLGLLMVEAGTCEVPTDLAALNSFNLDHRAHDIVARATALDEQPDGVYASIQFNDTPEGHAAYADAIDPNGKRRKLSAEFGPVKQIKNGKLVPGSAKLWGGALVEAGAYPSAMVLAADTPDGDGNAFDTVPPDGTSDDGAHINVAVDVLPLDITATTTAGDTATYTPDAAPAPVNPEGESNVTATATGAAAPATIPGAPQVLATATPAGTPAVVTPRPVDLQQVFAAMAVVRQNPLDSEAAHALAALTDITVGGADALPGSGVIQSTWLGQLYQGITYEREYITLGTLGTQITLGGKKGYRIHRGTSAAPIAGPDGIPNGGNWPGNKEDINSYNGFSQTAESFRRNFAVGDDIAREFYDLEGGAEVVEGFLKLLIEDYMFWSDEWARYDEVAAAGAPVAPKVYPANYPAEVGMLIQGILAVKRRKADKRRDVPTFAIANELAYEALAYAAGGAENLPAFVSLAISTASEGTVDGNVQIVEGDTGIETTSSVVVGAKRGIEFDELPGAGPLQINALDIARGGIDKAVHGYLQTFPVRTEAFVHIGVADAFAQDTDYELGRIVKYTTTTYRVVKAGTTAAANPAPPAVGATVVSGTATLLRLA